MTARSAGAVSCLRVAVIGTGSAGLRHLQALRALPDVEPVAVPVRRPRVAELAGEGYAGCGSVREAAEAGVRAAIIATDTGRHVEDALAAVACGMDLLIEKPVAATLADAQRLGREAARLGRRVWVGCTIRFSESLGAAREHLPEIGRIHSVRVECQSYLPDWRPSRPYRDTYAARPGEGGVLLDLVHEIDYTSWLFGWPKALHAQLANTGILGIAEEEAADLQWTTPGGARVSMALDYVTRPARRRLQACGERGTIEWDGLRGTVSLEPATGPGRVWPSSQTRDDTFRLQAEAFLKAVAGGPADPRLATLDEGARAVAVCEAARRSGRSRREEAVRA